MAVETRQDVFSCRTGIDTTQIVPTSRLVSNITGFAVQPNKAIVGANAFAHESGIHQDGLLKNNTTYEIMTPQSVGLDKSNLVIGKHSGSHAFKDRVHSLGYNLSDEELKSVFASFKDLADNKKEIFDEDIEALIAEKVLRAPDLYRIINLEVKSGTHTTPTAVVDMEIDGKKVKGEETGDGPVDAAFKAIKNLTGTKSKLLKYIVSSITGGTDAQGEVTVRIQEDDSVVVGQGAHMDIIMASVFAYVNALNRLEHTKNKSVQSLFE